MLVTAGTVIGVVLLAGLGWIMLCLHLATRYTQTAEILATAAADASVKALDFMLKGDDDAAQINHDFSVMLNSNAKELMVKSDKWLKRSCMELID